MRDDASKSRVHARAMRKEIPKAEVVLWNRLRELNKRGFKFRRQHPIKAYIADFAHVKSKLVIEIDGATHWTAERSAHDKRRDDFLRANGWDVMRFADTDIYKDVAAVVEDAIRRLTLT